MVHDLDLPMFVWADACCRIVYILNMCPHRVLKLERQDSRRCFTGDKLYVSHFRVFGSSIYIKVPEEKRMKLQPSSLKGIIVGYIESSKDYKIYVPC
jgi:hypothetical protein